jgi:iron(III) transport system substrate-binding protein
MRWSISGFLGVMLVWGVCSAAWGAMRDSASVTPQEEITVYTALLPENAQSYLASFQRAYPAIKVTLVRESTGPLIDRLRAERQDPQADVIWGLGVTSLVLLEWEDLLVPYAPAGLSRVLPLFRDARTPPYWVGIYAWILVYCVNPDQLARLDLPLPTAWRDLGNPVYRGHLGLADPVKSGTGYLLVDTVLQHYGKNAGWEYLDALHQNVPRYVPSSEEACRLAGSLGDEIAIVVTSDEAGSHQKKGGTPVELIFPSEGSGWDMRANALVKKRSLTIKPAAKTFLHWAISDGAMQAYARNVALTAVRLDNPLPSGFPSDLDRQLFDKDIMRSAAHRDIILREWQRRYGNKSASE